MSYKASTVSGMTDLDPGVEDSSLTAPKMTRWRPDQVSRAEGAGRAIGLSRSAIFRLAFDQGIAAVEAIAAGGSVPADPA